LNISTGKPQASQERTVELKFHLDECYLPRAVRNLLPAYWLYRRSASHGEATKASRDEGGLDSYLFIRKQEYFNKFKQLGAVG
jgi:hypothetical protein